MKYFSFVYVEACSEGEKVDTKSRHEDFPVLPAVNICLMNEYITKKKLEKSKY